MAKVGRNDPCPCGSGRKYKRCCLLTENQRASANEPREVGTLYEYVPDDGQRAPLTLLVETEAGMLVRRIPNASPLPEAERQGDAAEEATHDAAAVWGLPDFVFRPSIRKVGSGTRELGDGLLWVGDRGVVVQVKSREAPSDDTAKEQRWIGKKAAEALRQAAGSIRSLQRQPADLANARGHTLTVDGAKLNWLAVVVLDHPDPPPGLTLPAMAGPHPAVVMLRRDWEWLFNQLKSTHAVVDYLRRIAGEPVELGTEPMRYVEWARADSEADPDPIDPALLGRSGRPVSQPLLPMQPAGTEQTSEHLLVRSLFEDIAVSAMSDAEEDDRLRALAHLDALHVGQRAHIGEFVLEAQAEVSKAKRGETLWRLRRMVSEKTTQFAFGAGSHFMDEEHQAAFNALVFLRHHELQEILGPSDTRTTVAVVITPTWRRDREWDTTMCAYTGPIQLGEKELAAYREIWSSP